MPAETPDPTGRLLDQLTALRTDLARLGGLEVTLGRAPETPGPGLYAEVVRLLAPPYAADRSVSRLDAQVLVTASGDDHGTAADLLATTLLQLMADGRWEVVPGQPDTDLWRGLDRAGQLGFVVRVPLQLRTPRPVAPPVRHALEVSGTGARRVDGRVLAADGTPLARAVVRVVPDGRPVATGADGRWSLRVPDLAVRLEVQARGRLVRHDLPAADAGVDEPVDIVFSDLGADPAPASPSRP